MQLKFPNTTRRTRIAAGSMAVGAVCVCGAYWIVRGADHASSTVFSEVRRLTSPDGEIDAVLASTADLDAAISYQVAVVRRGMTMGQGKTVFVVDQVDDIEMRWRDERTLYVKSPRGRVFRQLLRMNSTDSLLADVKVEYGRR